MDSPTNPTSASDLGVGAFGVSLLSASFDCIKILDKGGALQLMNPNGQALMEVDDFCTLQGGYWPDLWPAESRHLVEAAMADAMKGKAARFSAYCPTAKGTPKWWDVSVSPVQDTEGGIIQMVSISRDITEERRLSESYRLLTQELSHRIKNLFTLANGLISLAAAADPSAKPFAARLRDRFTALGHAVSYIRPVDQDDGQNRPRSLFGLFERLVEPFQSDPENPRVHVSGCDGLVGPQSATSLALIVHELATNAVKYGALSVRGGQVDLACEGQGEQTRFTWTERGGPAVAAAPAALGFGAKLAQISASGVLGGTIVHDWRPEGLVVVIEVKSANLLH